MHAPRKARLWLAWILGVVFFWLARPFAASLWIGGAIVLAGLLIRGWAAGILEKDRALAISGPYAFTRNPLYLGSFLLGTGAAVAGGRPVVGVAFLGFFAIVYGPTMARESTALEARFPDGYRHYRDSVPGFLPALARYRPPPHLGLQATPFSLTRYLRNREYEALLGAAAGMGLLVLKATGVAGFPLP